MIAVPLTMLAPFALARATILAIRMSVVAVTPAIPFMIPAYLLGISSLRTSQRLAAL